MRIGKNVSEFNEYCEKMNAKIPGSDNLVLKRLFNLPRVVF